MDLFFIIGEGKGGSIRGHLKAAICFDEARASRATIIGEPLSMTPEIGPAQVIGFGSLPEIRWADLSPGLGSRPVQAVA